LSRRDRVYRGLWRPSASQKFLVASGAALLITFAPHASLASDPAGQVEQVRGEAVAEARGSRRALFEDGPVFVGDLVRTGENARLGLRLGSATAIKLGALTRLKIDRFIVDAGGEFNLSNGSLLFDRASGARPLNVRFRNAYGLIAVRGTQFYAGMSLGKFGVFVTRGRVAVTAGGRTVIVGPQQGTQISRPGAPPAQPSPWSNERVEDMVRRFR
jgi:hypothetical protein